MILSAVRVPATHFLVFFIFFHPAGAAGRPNLHGAVIVDNRIANPSGEIVPITYLLRKLDGKWRIVDSFLTARHSELDIRRSEYRSTIKRQGVESLIRRFNEETIGMKSNSSG